MRGVLAPAVHDLLARQLGRPRGRAAACPNVTPAAAPVVPLSERNCAPAPDASDFLDMVRDAHISGFLGLPGDQKHTAFHDQERYNVYCSICILLDLVHTVVCHTKHTNKGLCDNDESAWEAKRAITHSRCYFIRLMQAHNVQGCKNLYCCCCFFFNALIKKLNIASCRQVVCWVRAEGALVRARGQIVILRPCVTTRVPLLRHQKGAVKNKLRQAAAPLSREYSCARNCCSPTSIPCAHSVHTHIVSPAMSLYLATCCLLPASMQPSAAWQARWEAQKHIQANPAVRIACARFEHDLAHTCTHSTPY